MFPPYSVEAQAPVVGSVQKPKRRRKSAKDGEKRRKTAKYSELRCNYENLSKLVNKIYTSAERDRKFW